ncbi:hypothetical protein MSHO_61250 [Mycobacterium shottsii]|uniref:TetR family transcriptional regulator n=1 Tax=Mycobacterium shottsii TaxID=133549 RepID=A0A7I7LMG2_9MYCO|nr:hypothetical protein MSHO_61250 [Mycobacterium shottsii]
MSEDDQHQFIEHVASRMGVDARIEIRPALLVHTSLGTVKFVFDRWLSTDPPSSPIFHVQMDQVLRIALAGFR